MAEYDLQRFVRMQMDNFEEALRQVKDGCKYSHWIWYIFPQLKGLGMSPISEYYGIDGLDEAEAYMQDDFLRENLITISEALLALENTNATAVFGFPDVLKVCSCMTLFSCTQGAPPVFEQVIDKYYQGKKDEKTLAMLGLQAE